MKNSKKHLVSIALLAFSLLAKSQKVDFANYNGWNPLLQNAKAEHKKIFIYFHASWCAPCRVIEQKYFTDSSIAAAINQQSINISVDLDQPATKELVKKYRVLVVPTLIVLNEEGYLLERTQDIPVADSSSFVSCIQKVYEKKEPIKGITNHLQLDYPAFYNNFFGKSPRTEPEPAEVNTYLDAHEKDLSELYWSVLSSFANNADGLDRIISHHDTLRQLFGKEVSEKIGENYWHGLRKCVDDKDSVGFSKLITVLSKNWAKEEMDRAFTYQWLEFLSRTGMDWERCLLLAQHYQSNYGSYRVSIEGACDNMNRTCFDATICAKMMNIVQPDMDKQKPRTLLIYGNLYLKANNQTMADSFFAAAIAKSTAADKYKIEEKIKSIRTLVNKENNNK